ncbi:hypothetical protein [Synechococcus phage Ssp-JY42]|nr:hypothetical protein [Synechococcus phage Yong-M4-211]
MLNDQIATLNTLVWEIVSKLGARSAPPVADAVMPLAFARSLPELEQEGGVRFLRDGLIKHIKDLFSRSVPEEQQDLAEIDPSFGELVARLPKESFFVPSLDAHLSVARLIAEPNLLDEARRFTRQKGLETLATADALDQLYAAVVEARAA